MNVAFIITRADAIGGATVHLRDLARGMLNQGHQVMVLVGGTGEVTEEFTRAGIPFRSLKWLGRAIHPAKDVLAALELKRLLSELRPDLVHTHTAKAGLVGRWAARQVGIPVLYTPHGWPIGDRISSKTAWLFRAAERAVAPYSASIINVCDAERTLARQHQIAPDAKLAVIHNGVHDVAVELRGQPDGTPARLVMVARFEKQKDHATLLTALSSLKDLAWEMEFVGGGPGLNAARAQAAQLGIDKRVAFSGSASDVAGRVAMAQVLVLSSFFEGFPLSILEGMRAGLPAVSSDVGGVREAIVDGETGFVVKPRDAAALSQALRALIADPQLRLRMGNAGRLRYEKYFTFAQMLRQTIALYQSALSPRDAGGLLGSSPIEASPVKEAVRGH